MSDHMDKDPALGLAELWLDFARAMEIQFEVWAQQADLEPDPVLVRMIQQVASDAMTTANSTRAAAAHLMREIE